MLVVFFSDEYGNSIPIIDLAAMQAGTPEKRNGVIKQIAKACQEWGFFQVVNHSFPLDLLAEGFENSMEFFNSPLEEKLKCKHPKGSVPVPAAFINDMSTKGVPDRKEMMFIHSDSSPMARFNLWPKNPANFRLVGYLFSSFAVIRLRCKFVKLSDTIIRVILFNVTSSNASTHG